VKPTITVTEGEITLGGSVNTVHRVGVFYIGENTIEIPVNAATWSTVVGYGKQFAAINGANGYINYPYGAGMPTLELAGNYAIFLKYTEPGTTAEKTVWATYTVEGTTYVAPEIEIDEAGNLSVELFPGDEIERIGVFYLGTNGTFKGSANPNFTELARAGKAYLNVNGANGYQTYTDAMPVLSDAGHYAIYVKYYAQGNKDVLKTRWFTPTVGNVEDAYQAPNLTIGENGKLNLNISDRDEFVRIGVFYLGTNGDFEGQTNPNFTELARAGKKYLSINGANGYQTYTDAAALATLENEGHYAIYLKYYENGDTSKLKTIWITTVYGEVENAYAAPSVEVGANGEFAVKIDEADSLVRVGIFYVGDNTSFVGQTNPNFTELARAGKVYKEINGSEGYQMYTYEDQLPTELENSGNYVIYVKYYENGNTNTLKTLWFTPSV